jgi:hypothetical protein
VAKTAQIFSVRTGGVHGFRWVWRSSGGTQHSTCDFLYFYECVEDARRAGYSIELPGTRARTIDGRDRHGRA